MKVSVTYQHHGSFGLVWIYRKDLKILPIAYYQTRNMTIAQLEQLLQQAEQI